MSDNRSVGEYHFRMVFPRPNYSRTQVNKAGSLLADARITVDNIPDHLRAYEVVSNWRSCHSYPINTFQITLRNKVRKVCDTVLIAQRLKRMESITAKLRRYPNMKLSTMQDIGGLRAIVNSAQQARELRDLYLEMTSPTFAHELVLHRDYLAEPKESGYRSIHLVYRYKNLRVSDYDGLQIELQIRSKLQHLWATAVETAGTFLKHSLKSSQGPSDWLEFFALTGSAFAHVEGLPLVPQYSQLSPSETFTATLDRAQSLRVREHLVGYTAVAEHIANVGGKNAYHLIVLDPVEQRVQVTPFSRNQLQSANEQYLEVEKKISNGETLQAVLVSAGKIADLKRAYPNYFLDTHEFISQLNALPSGPPQS